MRVMNDDLGRNRCSRVSLHSPRPLCCTQQLPSQRRKAGETLEVATAQADVGACRSMRGVRTLLNFRYPGFRSSLVMLACPKPWDIGGSPVGPMAIRAGDCTWAVMNGLSSVCVVTGGPSLSRCWSANAGLLFVLKDAPEICPTPPKANTNPTEHACTKDGNDALV